MQKNIIKKEAGYTIIETMISVALFIIIVTAGMGALLNANLLHQKSRDMRSIMDNLSFIMEDMSRNLRTGYDYHCINDGFLTTTNPHDCASGGGISFKSSLGGQWVYFIGTYNGSSGIFRSLDGGTTFIKLTSDEMVIDPTSSFSVSGAPPPPGDLHQPFVTIKLVGKIILNSNVSTPFSLRTSVSQRKIDI
jgi:type II secretory pathway pseudopilin PulG